MMSSGDFTITEPGMVCISIYIYILLYLIYLFIDLFMCLFIYSFTYIYSEEVGCINTQEVRCIHGHSGTSLSEVHEASTGKNMPMQGLCKGIQIINRVILSDILTLILDAFSWSKSPLLMLSCPLFFG